VSKLDDIIRNNGQKHTLLPRFLVSVVLGSDLSRRQDEQQKGKHFSQRGLGTALGVGSTQVNRWCWGTSPLTEKDLDKISQVTGIPKETFLALRYLDVPEVRTQGYFATAGVWPFLLQGTDTFTICGTSMSLGAHLLQTAHNEDLDELNVCLMDTCAQAAMPSSPLRRFAESKDGSPLSVHHSMWLATAKMTVGYRTRGTRRLWVRPTPTMIERFVPRSKSGILVANDYMAIEGDPQEPCSPFRVHMRGDETWDKFITPLLKTFNDEENAEYSGYSLVWSNQWGKDDERFARMNERIQAIHRATEAEAEF